MPILNHTTREIIFLGFLPHYSHGNAFHLTIPPSLAPKRPYTMMTYNNMYQDIYVKFMIIFYLDSL